MTTTNLATGRGHAAQSTAGTGGEATCAASPATLHVCIGLHRFTNVCSPAVRKSRSGRRFGGGEFSTEQPSPQTPFVVTFQQISEPVTVEASEPNGNQTAQPSIDYRQVLGTS